MESMKPALTQSLDILEMILAQGHDHVRLSLVCTTLADDEPAVVLVAEAIDDFGKLRKGNVRPLAVILHDDRVDLVRPPRGPALTAQIEHVGPRPEVHFHRHDLSDLDAELQALTAPPSKETP